MSKGKITDMLAEKADIIIVFMLLLSVSLYAEKS